MWLMRAYKFCLVLNSQTHDDVFFLPWEFIAFTERYNMELTLIFLLSDHTSLKMFAGFYLPIIYWYYLQKKKTMFETDLSQQSVYRVYTIKFLNVSSYYRFKHKHTYMCLFMYIWICVGEYQQLKLSTS